MQFNSVRACAPSLVRGAFVSWTFVLGFSIVLHAQPETTSDVDEARAWLERGRYEACLRSATSELENGWSSADWHTLRIRAQLALGRYEEAAASAEQALQRHRFDLRLYWYGAVAKRRQGDEDGAEAYWNEIERRGRIWTRRYDNPNDHVFLARAEYALGVDAKSVLDRHLNPAKRADATLVDARIAIAEIALDKHDDGLASDELRAALALDPDNAHVHYLMACAFQASDPELTFQHLRQALERNPRHVGARLLRVDLWITAESHAEAAEELDAILAIEPKRWEAWAYKAVLAHLAHDVEKEARCREEALATWKTNPGVDHLIGRELAEKYRFAEGADAQRRALALDESFLPAKFQLAQDLLRLGRDVDEGWKLAEDVLEHDPYQVVAYNLMTLKDRMARYVTLEGDGVVLRMEAREASIYGDDVLALLARARAKLGPRYGITLERPTTVELFQEQKDFAIRTFGLPGGAGYLGVCFGDVVTMNSPASQGEAPTNWRSVLWHEFCHVITLNKTRNRMPRWLSEGISVYEERLEDPRWGQWMTPTYREFVLAGRAPKISALSASFLRPEGPFGLIFAYYESSMVVEWIVTTHGHDVLVAILDDLGQGENVYTSLQRRIAPIQELDATFDAYLTDVARSLGHGMAWNELPAGNELAVLQAFADEHPDDWRAQMEVARQLISASHGSEAVAYLERAIGLYPEDTSSGNAYELLAAIHREALDTPAERRALERLVARDASDLAARLRLVELQKQAGDWQAVARTCDELRGIQPLLVDVHREALAAARTLGDHTAVVRAGDTLLLFDPADGATIRFELARAHEALGNAEQARRNVLLCLADAPRFGEALQLLLRLHGEPQNPKKTPDDGRSPR